MGRLRVVPTTITVERCRLSVESTTVPQECAASPIGAARRLAPAAPLCAPSASNDPHGRRARSSRSAAQEPAMRISFVSLLTFVVLAVVFPIACGGTNTMGDAAPSDGVASDTGSGCRVGEATCDGRCVNIDNDPAHCGRCGNACPGGQVCTSGRCAATCASGEMTCAGRCANVSFDNANCGTCGNACSGSTICQGGTCRCAAQSPPLTLCAGACVATNTDPANCGMCGRACAAGEVCNAGTCATMCGSTTTLCAGRCVMTSTDVGHCGACGNACPADARCNMGSCQCRRSGDMLCGAVCAATASDPANCGACGTACPAGQRCSSGTCAMACGDGLTACGASCVDTTRDPRNCGACGRACQPTVPYCFEGMCNGG